MTTPVSRYQVREKLINADEFSTGFYTTENYCERMKKHIQKMQELGGEHRNDIETYKNLMMKEDCTNVKVLDEGHDILATGGRRTRRKARKNLRKSKNKKSRRFYRRKSKK